MPRKVRQLKVDLKKAGFVSKSAKGSHTKWTHPDLPGFYVTLSGQDGHDAKDYQERDVAEALARLADGHRPSRWRQP